MIKAFLTRAAKDNKGSSIVVHATVKDNDIRIVVEDILRKALRSHGYSLVSWSRSSKFDRGGVTHGEIERQD